MKKESNVINIAIPSRGRPKICFEKTFSLVGGEAKVFVSEDEIVEYKNAGVDNVVVSPEGISVKRNFILDYYPIGSDVLFLDDDISKVGEFTVIDGKPKSTKLEWNDFFKKVKYFFTLCRTQGIYLFGMAPTCNPLNWRKNITYNTFIIGCACGVITTDLRFDESLLLKEDYDFTLQHVKKFRRTLRIDKLWVDAKHYAKSGGCTEYRNDILEGAAVSRLKEKWGTWVRDNPRRLNEIILNVPKVRR